MRPGLVIAISWLALLAGGCRGQRLSPEEQVRKAIAEVERAVEDKDLKAVARFISPQYRDKGGNDRKAVIGLVRLQFIRYPAIHLLVRVAAVDVLEASRARATAFVAMASVPVSGAAELPRVNADLYRFDLELAPSEDESGQWRLESATWGRAEPGQFL